MPCGGVIQVVLATCLAYLDQLVGHRRTSREAAVFLHVAGMTIRHQVHLFGGVVPLLQLVGVCIMLITHNS